jgi:hypothetical protein
METLLSILRVCLLQCREILMQLSDPKDRAEVERHEKQLKTDIAKLEGFEEQQRRLGGKTPPAGGET